MINDAQTRQDYKDKLITYYYDMQLIKNKDFVRRQVNNMDDRALERTYNEVFSFLKTADL